METKIGEWKCCAIYDNRKKADCLAFIKSLAFYWRFFEGNGEFNKVTAFFNNSITELVANRGIPQRHSSLMYCKTSRLQTQETIFFPVQQSYNECHKICHSVTTHAELQMSQSDFATLLEAGGSAGKTQKNWSRIGFGVTFDWLLIGARFFSQSQSTTT